MMRKTFYFLTLILLINSCKEAKKTVHKIEFETAYEFSSEIEDKTTKDTVPWKYQISASDYAAKGDYKNALLQWDLAMGGRERNFSASQIDSINSKYHKVKATDYIIEKAKDHQVVIINEAHHNSFHRVFTRSMLKKLFDLGYKNLGLEALGNGAYLDSTLNIRKYPLQKTGHYIKDPQFGNLVRDALEIGYQLFAYENIEKGSGKPREIEQAKNIERIIDSKPGEKFLIHCGFDHALEGKHKNWEKAMAGRLKEYTGINPLTVNQTLYSEKGSPELNHPLLKAIQITESTVLLDRENNPLQYQRGEAYTDIAVLHPFTEYLNNRPNWIFDKNYKNVSLLLDDIPAGFPVMVLAFKKGENIHQAVPVDITEVAGPEEKCSLGLTKGTYDIVVTNGKESYSIEKEVK